MSEKKRKLALVMISMIPNAYLLKSMLYFLPDITIVLYLIVYVITIVYWYRNGIKISFGLFDICIYLWALLLLTSVLYSPYPIVGIIKLSKLILLGFSLIMFIRILIRNKHDWEYLIKSYLITAFLLQICVIINFLLVGQMGRFSFFDAHPIPLGMLGATSVVIAVAMIIAKKISFIQFFLLITSSLWIVVLSSSKGPALAMILSIAMLLPSSIKHLKRNISLIILAILTLLIISKTQQYQLMVYRFLGLTTDESTYIRLELYQSAKDIFVKSPLIGGGLGVFNGNYPHSVYWEVLGEGGMLLGALLCLLFIWVFYKYIVYIFKYRNDVYYFTSIGVLMASIFVLLVSYTYCDLKFLYFGIGLVLVQKKLRLTPDPEPVIHKKKYTIIS
ncbi:MAG TPA: O-antigen ligase family protein [Desulfosporosinus sp.]|nr:O-antigen ligase family protein [Desulfosporosinus sp.]